jgi:hypothetical protein
VFDHRLVQQFSFLLVELSEIVMSESKRHRAVNNVHLCVAEQRFLLQLLETKVFLRLLLGLGRPFRFLLNLRIFVCAYSVNLPTQTMIAYRSFAGRSFCHCDPSRMRNRSIGVCD